MSYAPFKIRVYAFLLDFLVIAIYGIFVVGTISFVFRPYIESLFSNSPVTAEFASFFMITLPVSLYFILCDCSKWQGTLGKRKMGISVVDGFRQRIGIGCSVRSEEHTSELQSRFDLVCRLLLEKKNR